MYIDVIPNRNSPPAVLVRESYREDGKVKKRTVANISKLPKSTIAAIKQSLTSDVNTMSAFSEAPKSGPVYAVLATLNAIAKKIGITDALGDSRLARLVCFLAFARIAHQGSRLSAVRWANDHAIKDVLDLNYFDEDDLYAALDWAATNQSNVEDKLYARYVKVNGAVPALVLYDVTSSYFEGLNNELGEFGYNRDGKRGKKQIVIGLLTAPDGEPLSIEVFRGNNSDTTTFNNQVLKVVKRFKITEVVFVGDRGMIKSKGKKTLGEASFKYITALTDPQIKKLLKKNVLQPGLFDEQVVEVMHGEKRLILRRNEDTQRKEQYRRNDKLVRLKQKLDERNELVAKSKTADPEAGLRQFQAWIKRYKLSSFVEVRLEGKSLCIDVNQKAKEQDGLLDGCYVLESDVTEAAIDMDNLHDRYMDLQKVERDFRLLKTSLLEIRPIFVRKESRTQGHVFTSMLALKIVRYMESHLHAAFKTTDVCKNAETIDSVLTAISRICLLYYDVDGQQIKSLPKLDKRQAEILAALKITLNPPRT